MLEPSLWRRVLGAYPQIHYLNKYAARIYTRLLHLRISCYVHSHHANIYPDIINTIRVNINRCGLASQHIYIMTYTHLGLYIIYTALVYEAVRPLA